MYDIFIADCKREMRLRKMSNKDLAEATGYTTASINAFFSDIKARGKSANVGKAIADALSVEFKR